MSVGDWLLIASLGASLFVILSQIGVVRKLNEAQQVLELLTLRALIDAERRKRENEQNNEG
jgi:hypothetical protein